MNDNLLEISTELINDKVKFECRAAGKNPVIVDYVPPVGSGEGFTSLELLLASLSTCLGTTVKILAEKQLNRKIDNIFIITKGSRRSTHPTYVENISIDMEITCENLDPESAGRIIEYGKKAICPVINMLSDKVAIDIKYSVSEPEKAVSLNITQAAGTL